MKIKIILICIFFSFLTSCFIFEVAFSPCGSPNKKDFKFYDPNFVFDTLSNLNTKKVYFSSVPNNNYLYIFKFFKSGMVKVSIALNKNDIPKDFKKNKKNGRFGYFVLHNDTIRFTTSLCANNINEKIAEGIIVNKDTILLKNFSYHKYENQVLIDLILYIDN